MDETARHQAHKQFACEAFNSCWELIDLASRTPGQDREMIRRAEVSFWHWQACPDRTPTNDAIGYWQLARVYALTGEADVAREYGQAGLEVCESHQLDPFTLAYAWESLARAHALAGDRTACEEALTKARAIVETVEKEADRAALNADLETISVPESPESA